MPLIDNPVAGWHGEGRGDPHMHSGLRQVFLAVVAVAGDPVTAMAGCGAGKSATTAGGKAGWTVH